MPGVHVTVVAPATNQSGAGDKTTPGGGHRVRRHDRERLPGDRGQRLPAPTRSTTRCTSWASIPTWSSPASTSGRTSARPSPSPARSARPAPPPATGSRRSPRRRASARPADFPSGARAVVAWLDDFRLGRAGAPFQTVGNLNIPTCTTGAIRGTVVLPASTALNGRPYDPSNCNSTATTFTDDLDGFLAGYITLSDVGT